MIQYYLRDHTFHNDSTVFGNFVRSLRPEQPSGCTERRIFAHVNCRQEIEPDFFLQENIIVFVHAADHDQRKKWMEATRTWLRGKVIFVSRPGLRLELTTFTLAT